MNPNAVAGATDSGYVGSSACAGCHASEFQAWRESHHYQAMLPATDETVLGDFSGATFDHGGRTHRFFRDGDRFLVETDNADGEMQTFEIAYTFGFEPLQQYLIAFPGGRYQALSIAWDNRPESSGGQRWYHLYPNETIDHEDLLHWTGSFHNWNGRCAACHSTGLSKNFQTGDHTWSTSWAEINVACEACHGPGRAHRDWAAGERSQPDPGFANAPPGAGAWTRAPQQATASRSTAPDSTRPVEVCAGCHARRAEIAAPKPGANFHDLYQLSLLEDGLYYADGQIRDEVYVQGSFLQSRMYRAGVSCADCHDPHSGRTRAEGNPLCTRCHSADVFDQAEHHHHPVSGAGSRCVDCHMPATTYMGIDPRRDHGLRVPEPQLSIDHGIPNACNGCHEDRTAQWAASHLVQWFPGSKTRAPHAAALAAARANRHQALPALLSIAADPNASAIVRATALKESGRFPGPEVVAAARAGMQATDPLVRSAAVRALEALPPDHRYALLQPLIDDPSRSVRTDVAMQLADVSPAALPQPARGALENLRGEYLETLKYNADLPESQFNLGNFLARSGQAEAAERAYRQALRITPGYLPALLNLADLYRASGMDTVAAGLLNDALNQAPDHAPAHYALGLLHVRQGRLDAAVKSLARAAANDPGNPRYAYVHAVALYESGQSARALDVLRDALERHPDNAELRQALDAYTRADKGTSRD
ncbi:tetratricopeptide repeat protein [Elongatibacter sediminis]|uniref:Tetratricopeptide repeat protein n=1 Tax=Elongatibacter sediminis TaxID=3119006 RepID=A0AAW9RL81_9GAMM